MHALLDKWQRNPGWFKMLAAFFCGALMVPALPPWGFWPALALGLSLFYLILNDAPSLKSALGRGWAFGFGYFLFGLSWIANALLVEGNEYIWAWPLAVAGLPAALAFFPALAALAYKKLFCNDGSTVGALFGFICLLMLSEWLRGHILTGFPWNLYGYIWANALPVAQFSAFAGIYGLSLLTCFWATLPGYLICAARQGRLTGPALLTFTALLSFGAVYGWGAARLAAYPDQFHDQLTLRLVQPNIAQADKWHPDKQAENFETLLRLSAARPENRQGPTLILWPETAVSDFLLVHPQVQAHLQALLDGYTAPVYLATGQQRHQRAHDEHDEDRYYNSLVLYDHQLQPLAVYDKSHLVPFGEYIPLQKYIPIAPLVAFEGFVAGEGPETYIIDGLGAFSFNICYEIIFSGAVIDKSAPRPNWILNVTNDAWYGDSAGPRQHFAMGIFRAIEEGTPVIRAANTGISGVIGPTGRTVHSIALEQQAAPDLAVPQALEELPFYARHKDILFFIMLLGTGLVSFATKKIAWPREIKLP